MSPRALLGLLVAAGLLAGCTGCTGGPASRSSDRPSSTPAASSSPASSSAASSAAPVVPPAPPRGACYRLTARQLTQPTNDSPPVSCRGPHTARTIFVGRVGTARDGDAVGFDSAAVQRRLATTCPRKLAAYVGGGPATRALSRLDVVWYHPTLEQSIRGAGWFRCDLIAFGLGERLALLPPGATMRGVLNRPGVLARYGLCGTADPGAAGFRRVICGRPHRWRALSTVALRGARAYPGVAEVRRAGDAPCRAQARARAGGSLRFRYGWEWPTRDQWRAGQHYGYCWVPA